MSAEMPVQLRERPGRFRFVTQTSFLEGRKGRAEENVRGEPVRVLTGDRDNVSEHGKVSPDPGSGVILFRSEDRSVSGVVIRRIFQVLHSLDH